MPTSKNTSVNSTKVPALFSKIHWYNGTRNVDIGGGKYKTATDFLAEKGVKNVIFDPYNRTEEENLRAVAEVSIHPPISATVSNVLNVIKSKHRRLNVLKKANNWAKVTFISVYEGDGSGIGKETKDDCWQENRKLAEYIPEIEEVFQNVLIKYGVIAAWNDADFIVNTKNRKLLVLKKQEN